MGTAIIKIKIMPESPNSNLKEIEEKAKEIIKNSTQSEIKVETEPIAFGLNAITLAFALDEQKSAEQIKEKLNKIPNTSSAEIIDFRRAIG